MLKLVPLILIATCAASPSGTIKQTCPTEVCIAQPSPPSTHIFMPPNPAPPNQTTAKKLHLHHLLAERTTNYFHASASQCKNIELLAKKLNGTVVKSGQTFSYYAVVGPYTQSNGYGWGRAFQGDKIVPSMAGGVCQGASTLYSALLRTTLPIVERHNHSLTVPYLPPGEDATVSGQVLNFRFRNNQHTPILITAATQPNKRYLTIAVWGANAGPTVTVHHEILSRSPFTTVHRFNDSLSAGQTRVVSPGQVGVRAKTYVEIANDSHVTRRTVSMDHYRPSPRVIEQGRD